MKIEIKKVWLCLLCAIFLMLKGSLHAQHITSFATIKDKDGYVNVRDGSSKNAIIIDKLFENQIFQDQSEFGNGNKEWIYISYGKKDFEKDSINEMEGNRSGYIHKSRILYLDQLPQLNRKLFIQNYAEFGNDTFNLAIRTGIFIPGEHEIEKDDDFVLKIDHVSPWGFDGNIPELLEEIKSITVTYKEQEYSFPKKTLSGIYNPNIDNMYVVLSEKSTIFVVMSNGDAAGAYNVVWTIQNYEVVSRFINRDF